MSLSLSVSPAVGWRPIQGATRLLPLDSWDRLQQTPATQKRREAEIENGQKKKKLYCPAMGTFACYRSKQGSKIVRVIVKIQQPCQGRIIYTVLHTQCALGGTVPVVKCMYWQCIYKCMHGHSHIHTATYIYTHHAYLRCLSDYDAF